MSTRMTLVRLAAGGAAAVAVLASMLFGTGGASSGSPTAQGWRPIWTANFGGPPGAGLNRGVWWYRTGKGIIGTHEIETLTDSTRNVHVDGHDSLDIVATGHGAPDRGGAWWSGRIQTWRLFEAPAGGQMLVTARIRQPGPAHGLGYWPAFWMVGLRDWPHSGEIDILEDINALSTHSGTLHCGNLTHPNRDGTFGPCHEGKGFGSGRRPCPGCQRRFHDYSVVVDRRHPGREQIRWYFDGRRFFTVNESQVGRATWAAAIDHGMSIVLDVAEGGAYPDIVCHCVTPTARTSSGSAMVVRQLAVYVK